ncbi:common central domain of tyrosinase domain-containing protein [Ditylenchus destructor]|nr:common central domain of tyrosinase domain-containing protein [Ditylenchus destructor]
MRRLDANWRRAHSFCAVTLSPMILVRVLLLVTLLLMPYISAQFATDCSDAPDEATRNVCLELRRGDRNGRQRADQQQNSVQSEVFPPSIPGSPVWQQPIPVPPNARGQVATHPYDCMTLQCLCPFFGGRMSSDGNCYLSSGAPLAMAYRKEYRMMTDNERQRFHYALTVLKQNGEYDRLSSEHLAVGVGSGAHSGPGFLPWHREYLKRVEIAIRLIDPTLAIPYWDSVMDGYLPDPRQSVMFSPDFVGETEANGFVVTGPFAFWRTLEGRPYILRQLAMEGQLFTEAQLNNIISQTNVEYVLAYTVPLPGCPYPPNYGAMEYVHSNIHLWLGGDMKPPATSANDPIFFMHHSFVDLIWEIWRQARQPRWIREQAYTPDLPQCANPLHFSYAQMRPFSLLNRDGLSNSYTDQMYRYAPRPICSAQAPTCGSKWLFCDYLRGYPHCVAKIKLGGWCSGFEGLDACYMGQCYFGRCVPGPTPPPFQPPTPAPPPSRTSSSRSMPSNAIDGPRGPPATRRRALATTPFVDCFNRNPCCDDWARKGECRSNRDYMREYCRVSCKLCTPAFNSSSECPNQHVSCRQWSEMGQCRESSGSVLFMQENCRQSCNLCQVRKLTTCMNNSRKINNDNRPGPNSRRNGGRQMDEKKASVFSRFVSTLASMEPFRSRRA